MDECLWYHIGSPRSIRQARVEAEALARELGFSEERAADVGLAASELGNNLVLHAGEGELLVQATADVHGLELLSLDRGPGVSEPSLCFLAGFSTAGSSGNGLYLVQQLASSIELHSEEGGGTVVACRFLADPLAAPPGPVSLGALNPPHAAPRLVRVEERRVSLQDPRDGRVLASLGLGADGRLRASSSPEAAVAVPHQGDWRVVDSSEPLPLGPEGSTLLLTADPWVLEVLRGLPHVESVHPSLGAALLFQAAGSPTLSALVRLEADAHRGFPSPQQEVPQCQ